MSDLVSIPELDQLFRSLQSQLVELPENASSINLLQLYDASHRPQETGSTENLFDPYQLTCTDNPKGLWCYTPVFYHENQKGNQRRKVPGGRGSWQKKADNKQRGQAWCMQRLEYEIGIPGKPGTSQSLRKFYMKQYTLDKPLPTYALCQIYAIKTTQPSASATANEHPGQQTDHGTGAIAHGQEDAMHMVTGSRGTQLDPGSDGNSQLPENIITQTHDSGATEQLSKGSASDTREAEQNQLNRCPNSKGKTIATSEWGQFVAQFGPVVEIKHDRMEIDHVLMNPKDLRSNDQVAQEDHSNIHGDAPDSSIGIWQAQGHLTSMRGAPSGISVQGQNSTRKTEFRFLVEDLFDGTRWGVKDNDPLCKEIENTNPYTYTPLWPFDAPQERDIEHGQSSMHSHVAEYGTTDNLQGNNSGHQSYMPSQEGWPINYQNYQQSYLPMNALWAGDNSNSLAYQRNVHSNEPFYMPDESSNGQD